MVDTFFTEKRIIKKIIIAIIFVFMFNFTFSYLGTNIVFAADTEEVNDQGAFKLLIPIHDFILYLSDAVMNLLQHSFVSSEDVTIKATSKDFSSVNAWAIAGIIIAAAVIITVVAVVVITAPPVGATGASALATSTGLTVSGGAAGAAGFTVNMIGGTVVLATAAPTSAILVTGAAIKTVLLVGGTILGGLALLKVSYDAFVHDLKGDFDLPNIKYTPERIFSNQIPLFDINFFTPVKEKNENRVEIALDLNGVNTDHPYIMAKSLLAFLMDYAKDHPSNNLGSFVTQGVQENMLEIPDHLQSLVSGPVLQLAHDSVFEKKDGNGIYLNGNSLMTDTYKELLGYSEWNELNGVFRCFMDAVDIFNNSAHSNYQRKGTPGGYTFLLV